MVVNINKIFKRVWYVEFASTYNAKFNRVELTYSAIMMDPTAPGQKWFCRIWWGGKDSFFKEAYGNTKYEAYRKTISLIDKIHYRSITGNFL